MFFSTMHLSQNLRVCTPDACSASWFGLSLRWSANASTWSWIEVNRLFVQIAPLPCPYNVCIGLSPGARLGNQRSRMPRRASKSCEACAS